MPRRSHPSICPWCGKLRATINSNGVCRPCRLVQDIYKRDEEITKLLAKVDMETRINSIKTEQARIEEHQAIHLRKLPNETEREYALRIEVAEIKRLARILATKRKRIDRLKNYIEENQ